MNPAGVPDAVVRAALAFGFDPAALRSLPGASRETWALENAVLRVRSRAALRVELAALVAARQVVPAPRVLATVDVDDTSAALLEKLPGIPAGDLDGLSPAGARRRGIECARLYELIASVRAPDLLAEADPARAGTSLLHLDLHPFNILIEDERVSAVVDWANAARGDPDLDRARTLAVLTLDPAARERADDPTWAALADGWIDAGGLSSLPASARAWAYRYLLADLGHRYSASQLAHVRAALDELGQQEQS